jgi:hypothetical protein
MGGNLIIYDGDVSTKTANLTTVKCMLNSVISTDDGRFMTGDLKDLARNRPRRVRVRTHPGASHPRPHHQPIRP